MYSANTYDKQKYRIKSTLYKVANKATIKTGIGFFHFPKTPTTRK